MVAEFSEFGFEPVHEVFTGVGAGEFSGFAPVCGEPGFGELGRELGMRHELVGAFKPDADAGAFCAADDEVGTGEELDKVAVRTELALGENANSIAFVNEFDCAPYCFGVGGGLSDGESAPPFEKFAEKSPIEQFSAGHEVEEPGAGILHKNWIGIGHVIGEN